MWPDTGALRAGARASEYVAKGKKRRLTALGSRLGEHLCEVEVQFSPSEAEAKGRTRTGRAVALVAGTGRVLIQPRHFTADQVSGPSANHDLEHVQLGMNLHLFRQLRELWRDGNSN